MMVYPRWLRASCHRRSIERLPFDGPIGETGLPEVPAGGTHAAVLAFFLGGDPAGDSANISNGFSLRSFSPGIGTGYSPVKQPRHTSSRECLSAEMRPRRER